VTAQSRPSAWLTDELRNAAAHPLRSRPRILAFLVSLALLVTAIQLLVSVFSNPAFQWDVAARYLFDGQVLRGLWLTVWLTAVVFALSTVLGVLLTLARLSSIPVLSAISWAYVWFFRSVPLLVQLVFWFNIGYLYPQIAFGLPFLPPFFELDSRNLVSSVMVAVIALTLHEAAYAAEIVRGGIFGVSHGQREAAQMIGLSGWRTNTRIIFPQAMRSILPPLGSQAIGILKATSLVSIIAVADLMSAVGKIYNRTFEVIPLLMVATVWYLVITSLLSIVQGMLEQRYGRGVQGRSVRTTWFRWGTRA
jgi:polar amino acid transport system permease protein